MQTNKIELSKQVGMLLILIILHYWHFVNFLIRTSILNDFIIQQSELFNQKYQRLIRMIAPPINLLHPHKNSQQIPSKPTEEGISIVNELKLQSFDQKHNDTRPNHKIIIRKNKNRVGKDSSNLDKSLRKTVNYLSNRSPAELISSSNHIGLSERNKQKYMDIVQNKIMNKNEDTKMEASSGKIKFNSSRYNNHLNSKINIKQYQQRSKQPSAEQHQHIAQRTQYYVRSFRSRSRTMAKEQLSSNAKLQETHEELSKTIGFDASEQKQKMHKSLIEIQKYQKMSAGRQTNELLPNYSFIKEEAVVPVVIAQKDEVILQLDSTIHIHNTQTYQKQINTLTKDYFQQWERMNFTKSKLYKSLRKKIVSVFPNMKKHYKEFMDSSVQKSNCRTSLQLKQRKSVQEIALTLRSEQNQMMSNLSTSNNPNEIKDYEQKIRQFNQKQLLRDIFKQAYFWSRTKNKFMNNNFEEDQQAERQEMRNIKKIQTKLTFINYMKSKNNKSEILNNRSKIKGSNIMRNKDVILGIEKQGSKQHQFLKKCLENAIQNCAKPPQ